MSNLLDAPPRGPAMPPGGEPEILHVTMRETAVVVAETTIAGLPRAIGEALTEVEHRMTGAGVPLLGPPFVRYLAMEPEIRAEIGFPVRGAVPPIGRVRPSRLPGGTVARVLHVGPYEGIAATYAGLQAWLATRGRTVSGPMWEIYWTDPGTHPDPATWRTEIVAPLDG